MSSPDYDVIVVGAGSSGGALAARLSEDPHRRVLVLEAGRVYGAIEDLPKAVRDPADVSGGTAGSELNWNLVGEFADGFTAPVARGKVIGGSSSINAAYFIRGTPADFAGWAALGNDEWSYDEVLPYFRRAETDREFGDNRQLHGATGPIPVRREQADRAPEFTSAFTEAAIGLGFPMEVDKNGSGAGGVGPVPGNVRDGLRVGTAAGYLIPASSRPNLTIVGGARVTAVLFEGDRCVGVEAVVQGVRTLFRGGETVLAAGALRTPQLLLLSGIGPADELRRHGLAVRSDLQGVGRGLTDHPKMSSRWTYDHAFPPAPGRSAMTSAINWTAEGSWTPGDLEILPFVATRASMFGGDPTDPSLATPVVQVCVTQEDSRGEVELVSGDPMKNPRLTWNFFRSERDRVRIREAMRVLVELYAARPLQEVGARLLDIGPSDVGDGDAADKWMRSRLNYAGHASCTCRMGPESDPMAVVDQRGRVRGVRSLRICDQSVFPRITSRGPAATAIMLGERMSAFFD